MRRVESIVFWNFDHILTYAEQETLGGFPLVVLGSEVGRPAELARGPNSYDT